MAELLFPKILWKDISSILKKKKVMQLYNIEQSLVGVIHAFCLDFPPLEYIPIIPPHSTYLIVLGIAQGKIIDVYNDKDIATQFVF